MVVKGNQPELLRDIERLFTRAEASVETDHPFRVGKLRVLGEEPRWKLTHHIQSEVGHGRIELRTLSLLALPQWRSATAGVSWPGAQQVFRLHRQVRSKKSAKAREEVVYGITSLPPEVADAKRVLHLNRSHWGIENRSHWRRDVLWGEDQCRAHTGSGPQVLAMARNVALALFAWSGEPNMAHALRRCAAQPSRVLALLTKRIE
jgi:predicted transposase YbfD/YdcC